MLCHVVYATLGFKRTGASMVQSKAISNSNISRAIEAFESKRTRYYIKDFLNQFETAYEKIKQSINNLDPLSRDTLQFLTNQILSMIRKLNQAL